MRPAFLPRHAAPAKPPIHQRIYTALDRAALRAATFVVEQEGLSDLECIRARLDAEADLVTATTPAKRFAASREMARWTAELQRRGIDPEYRSREELTALAEGVCPPCTGHCNSGRTCPHTTAAQQRASDDAQPILSERWFLACVWALVAVVVILVANGVVKL